MSQIGRNSGNYPQDDLTSDASLWNFAHVSLNVRASCKHSPHFTPLQLWLAVCLGRSSNFCKRNSEKPPQIEKSRVFFSIDNRRLWPCTPRPHLPCLPHLSACHRCSSCSPFGCGQHALSWGTVAQRGEPGAVAFEPCAQPHNRTTHILQKSVKYTGRYFLS